MGWPWLCLGGSLALFAVLLATDAARSTLKVSRWHDRVWLAWLTVPMLMLHMFEEYGFDLLGRTYLLPETLAKNLGYPPYPECPIPLAHYPLINLGIAWVSAPLAAWISRRNLVIGLSWYGRLIFNGVLHVVATLAGGLEAGSAVLTPFSCVRRLAQQPEGFAGRTLAGRWWGRFGRIRDRPGRVTVLPC